MPPPNSCHVTGHLLVVHGLEDVVFPGTVVVAGARLDEHHVLLHDLPIRTFELHGEGGGPVGGAAPAVQADAAELGPVGLGGGAAGDFKLHGLWHSGSPNALFSFLQDSRGTCQLNDPTDSVSEVVTGTHLDALLHLWLTGSHHTEPGLLLQPAFVVIIGDPGGDAEAAGLGAGAPFCGLNQAVLPHHVGIWAISLFLSESCEHRGKPWISIHTAAGFSVYRSTETLTRQSRAQ